MAEPEATKKAISDKQLAANRANALKSTGPRTERGKSAARYNNLQHGMRAVGVLPGEDGAAYVRRLEQWEVDLNARSDAERYLVERAVKASWKMDRGDAVEGAAATALMIDAAEGADDREAEQLDRLVERLAESPGEVIRRLRLTPAGCRWARAQWLTLQRLLADARPWLWTQRRRAIHLLGKRVHDALADDPLVTRWLVAQLAATFGNEGVALETIAFHFDGEPPEGMHRSEFEIRLKQLADALPDAATARAQLRSDVAAAIAELDDRLELVEALAGRDRALAVERAKVDRTAAGAKLLQYQMAHERSYQAALRRLEALQDPRRPSAGGIPKTTKESRAAEAGPGAHAQPPTDPQADAETTEPISTPAATAEPRANAEMTEPIATAERRAGDESIEPISTPFVMGESKPAPETTEPIATAEPEAAAERTGLAPTPEPDAAIETTEPIAMVPAMPRAGARTTEPISTAEAEAKVKTTGPISSESGREDANTGTDREAVDTPMAAFLKSTSRRLDAAHATHDDPAAGLEPAKSRREVLTAGGPDDRPARRGSGRLIDPWEPGVRGDPKIHSREPKEGE